MAGVIAKTTRELYILTNGSHLWVATLATNRRNCWEPLLKYATKQQLRRKGIRCVKVRLEVVR